MADAAVLAEAEAFLRGLKGTKRQQERLLRQAPWDAVRTAAVEHPDVQTRLWMLFLLDHHTNDDSTETFARALHDLDSRVRISAFHSITCTSCKEEELCVADVVPELVDVLLHDPVLDLRMRSLTQLVLWLPTGDARIREALRHAAKHDADAELRHAASEGLQGRLVRPRKQYERSIRRHASTRPRR